MPGLKYEAKLSRLAAIQLAADLDDLYDAGALAVRVRFEETEDGVIAVAEAVGEEEMGGADEPIAEGGG